MKSALRIILSSVTLFLPWLEGFFWTAFFSWLPLFLLWKEENKPLRRAFYTYIVFLIWNAGVSWWIWLASPGGALLAISANALLMTMVAGVYFAASFRIRPGNSLWLFVPLWMSFEYLHQHWDLSWTWLTLGNIFSDAPSVVRWYSITGTSGGTFWILSVNILLFTSLTKKNKKVFAFALLLLFLPLLSSFLLKLRERGKTHTVRYLIVQPNIDPYNEKFYYYFDFLYDRTKKLMDSCLFPDDRFDLVLFPETFITYNLKEKGLNRDPVIERFRKDFILSGRTKYILTGASTYCFYRNEKPSSTARLDKQSGYYYDMFNTAVWITSDTVDVYHKSILVPGVEKMPFPAIFGFLEKFAIDLGGTSGSLGIDPKRKVFGTTEGWKVAPIICYESVYGEYVGDYVRSGACVLCVITNDGWWGNTPGHRQHFRFGKLRCLEYHLPLLRSANTGISASIRCDGNIMKLLPYQQAGVISGKMEVSENPPRTFYAAAKDILSRTMLLLSAIILLGILIKKKNIFWLNEKS